MSDTQIDGVEWGSVISSTIGIYRHSGDKPPNLPVADLGVRIRIWKTP